MFAAHFYELAKWRPSLRAAATLSVGAALVFSSALNNAAEPGDQSPYQVGKYGLEASSVKKLRSWQAAIDKLDEDRADLVDAIIEAVCDEKLPREERREAVFLLGRIGTPKCFEFLISHILLSIPKEKETEDRDFPSGRPCVYALAHGDWRAAQAVLSSLDERKTDQERRSLAYVLRQTLGDGRAELVVDEDLRVAAKPEVRRNLAAISEYVRQM